MRPMKPPPGGLQNDPTLDGPTLEDPTLKDPTLKEWRRVQDLNPRPSVYKTAALPLC